jgi:predicted ArsR family transcriptional regulator
MKTARQRILEYLEAHRAVTTGELSRALDTTEANIRRHLAILQEQGQAAVVGERPSAERGRPARLFGLSEQVLGNNLDLLASALLEEMSDRPEEESPPWAERTAARLYTRMAGSAGKNPAREPAAGEPKSGSLGQRLYHVVGQLNHYHYQARWEAHREAPRLILGHCPYAGIIEQHPELCQVDAILLSKLLRSEVQPIALRERDRLGMPHCVFRVNFDRAAR